MTKQIYVGIASVDHISWDVFHESDVYQHKLKPTNSVADIIRKMYWVTAFMALERTGATYRKKHSLFWQASGSPTKND